MLTLDSDVKACGCSDNLSLQALYYILYKNENVWNVFLYCGFLSSFIYGEISLYNKLTDWAPSHIQHAVAYDCGHFEIWLCAIYQFRRLFISLTGWDSWQLQLGCAEAFHWQSGPGWSPTNGGGQPALRKLTKPVSNRPWWFWRVFWGRVPHSQPDPLILTTSNVAFLFIFFTLFDSMGCMKQDIH